MGSQNGDAHAAAAAYAQSLKDSAASGVALKLAMRSIFRDHGFVWTDHREVPPIEKLNNDAIKAAILEILPKHRVTSTEDQRIHRYAVTGSILTDIASPPPAGDPDAWDALDPLQRAAWHQCEQHVWKLIQDKFSGTLQRMIRDDEDLPELVMVKSGDFVYLTAEPRYVQAELYRPLTDKAELQLVVAAGEMARFEQQLPALKGKAVPALNAAAKRAGDKARAAYLLAADENGDDAEE